MKKCLWVIALALCFGRGSFAAVATDGNQPTLWLVQEEFVKLGKKELYEDLKQSWLNGFKMTKKGAFFNKNEPWQIIGMQDGKEPQYVYLVPLKNYASLGSFFQACSDYEKGMTEEESQRLQTFRSTINFTIPTLHQYLFSCSYLPANEGRVFEQTPYVHFWIVGITPGYDTFFEGHIEKMAQKSKEKNAPVCWRVWKALIGADCPKYIIMFFSSSQEGLEHQVKTVQFVDNTTKDIIRNQKQGSAVMCPELSLFP